MSRRKARNSVKKRIKPYAKGWASLTPSEQTMRVRALDTIRRMKEGESLSKASKSVGISPRNAKLNLGRYIYKRRGRWKARHTDHIGRGLTIYERGKLVDVVVDDSETASLIGQYLNDVKKALFSGDQTILKKYKKVSFNDSKGKKHKLETRLDKLKEIELGREDIEMVDIYASY